MRRIHRKIPLRQELHEVRGLSRNNMQISLHFLVACKVKDEEDYIYLDIIHFIKQNINE